MYVIFPPGAMASRIWTASSPGLLQAHERVAVLLLPYLEQVQVVAVHVTKIISGACCVHKETLLPARTVPG